MDSHSSLVDSHPWQIRQRSQLISILVCRNKLKLTNHDKAEIVVIFSMYHTRPLFSDFNMGNATLTTTANKAKSLGVVFDDKMLFDAHVSIFADHRFTSSGTYQR